MWFTILSILFVVLTYIPLIQNQHWFFRFFEFAKIQLVGILGFITVLGFFLVTERDILFFVVFILNLVTLLYQLINLFPYTKWYTTKKIKPSLYNSKNLVLISANVFQENKETALLFDILTKQQPDMILTMSLGRNLLFCSEKQLN
jgi:hypothetical protein